MKTTAWRHLYPVQASEREKTQLVDHKQGSSFYSILLRGFEAFSSIRMNAAWPTPLHFEIHQPPAATVELPAYDPSDKESCSHIALLAAAGGRRGNRSGNTLSTSGKPAFGCDRAVRDILGGRCTRCFRETIRRTGSS